MEQHKKLVSQGWRPAVGSTVYVPRLIVTSWFRSIELVWNMEAASIATRVSLKRTGSLCKACNLLLFLLLCDVEDSLPNCNVLWR